jgi:hypothetical protein
MDLKIDYATGDIVFVNRPLLPSDVTRPLTETVAQRLFIQLRTFLGEWFLNTNYGVPYFQNILGRKTTKAAVDLIMQQQILAEVGVKEITYFSSTLVNRQYSLNFRVKVVDGSTTDTISITPPN